ncbi:cadherin-like domain-containing protein [Pseudomonas sp. MF6772]|uniref:Ig-like domain-containing protein n=1 Tax=Pseudomonas TaxID=286 RepID=UPI0018E8DF03|nr:MULTISPECIES: Ig-like domain-containing protein [Pseudomonas]MBJ2267249.1 cadherin-like domain-containing protein [Pseudomonas sp. MF6772]MBL7226933.1 cadherin-like domain-containing protein [Pseudomonas sp.]MDD1135527.1 Ig-like domain-containing protein [Pseudomonas shahriarae]
MNNWPRLALNALGLTLLLSGNAFAQLADFDPGPYTFATGKFPMWYEDNNQLKMELCQSLAVSSRTPATVPPSYMCILGVEPGVYDDTLPMIFPDNWPPEAFWFHAETAIPQIGNSGYELEVYVAGIEAAFANENPVDGDQQSFARIRLRVSVPTAGTYTITHPYGVETINVTTPGRRAINITRDIGISVPGVFNGVLAGNIGPFLRSVNGPYTEVNPDNGGIDTFIGDPNLTEQVTGSPNNTNFVRIQGPAGTIQTSLFNVSGKILDNRAQTPVEISRATYRRTGSGAGTTQVEVFAKSANSSTLCLRETLALVAGPPVSPCLKSLLGDNNGLFFGQDLVSGARPSVLVVTATNPTGTTRPTAVSSKLTDLVKIQTARYSWSNHSLLIEATSTDEVAVPDMVAQGYGRLSKSGTLQRLTVADLTQPPASVTVKSAAGGSDTELVVVVGTAPSTGENQAPVAVADTGSTSFGVPITLNLLANDSDPDANVPLSISALTQPAAGQGTVALNGTTAVVYTPPAVVATPLTTTFTYKAQDVKGLVSATAATVTITVAPNRPPVAVADSIATLGVAIPINVLANDTDPEGNVPLGVASLTQPAAGRGTVSSNGTVITYTPPATVTTAFTTTFTYIARDSFGALSTPATVTVQVSPRPATETFTVTTATVQARSNNRFNWDFAGTSSVTTGNTITVQVTTPTGLVTLGTTTVPVTGRWRLTVSNVTNVIPSANPTATIRSSQGTVRTVSVTSL